MEQLSALQKVCEAAGTRLHHVKPHGALYNLSAADEAVATTIAAAVHQFDASLWLVGLAGSVSTAVAEAQEMRTIHEFFADRSYQPDGSLTPRTQPGALIEDCHTAVAQALRIVQHSELVAANGTVLRRPMPAGSTASICLHGDGPHALLFASEVFNAFQTAGIRVAAP
jgi:UPF0271 protein